MSLPESEILKRIQQLEEKISISSFLAFSYVQAILALLNEKGLVEQNEFQAHLEKAKQELSGMMKDAEFFRMMGDLGKNGGDGSRPVQGGSDPAET